MIPRAVSLDQHRADLLRRSAELRSELEECAEVLRDRLHPVDEGTRFFRRHAGKLLLGGAALMFVLKGPRRILKLAGPLAVAWPIARRWLPTLASLATRRRAKATD